jgi:hypothetical protein
MRRDIRRKAVFISAAALLALAGYLLGSERDSISRLVGKPSAVVLAAAPEGPKTYEPSEGTVPKSYGKLVTAIADRIGTGLVFEDKDGVIRFVSITGMKEGQLARYDQTPTQGGIPKSYGRLVTAVVNAKGTGLIFEDAEGVIRFVTLTGEKEGELRRE